MNNPVQLLHLVFLIACFAACTDSRYILEPLDTGLDYGQNQVGFKSIEFIDETRDAIPFADWNGNLYQPKEPRSGRSLVAHLWFPTNKPGRQLQYQDYVERMIDPAYVQTFGDEPLHQKIIIEQIQLLSGDTSFSRPQLEQLLELPMYATEADNPSEAGLPTIIFPGGSSPAYQSILCEYLASHGYLVVAVALKGQYSHACQASEGDLNAGLDDLRFVIQSLIERNMTNGEFIGLIGNAVESMYGAAYAAQSRKVDAFISLEGGFLTNYQQRVLQSSGQLEIQNFTTPTLAIYAPHPSVAPQHAFPYICADRYFVHFPNMSEFHMLNFGIFDRIVPEILGSSNPHIESGYRRASELVLQFLDAVRSDSLSAFEQELIRMPDDSTIIDTFFIKEAVPVARNIAEVKNLYQEEGIAAVIAAYNDLKSNGNLEPWSQTFFEDFGTWLGWNNDPDYQARLALYTLAVDSYAHSALFNFYLGSFHERVGDNAEAKGFFQSASDLLDTDQNLDARRRILLKEILPNKP